MIKFVGASKTKKKSFMKLDTKASSITDATVK